jgi:hypothetical protein
MRVRAREQFAIGQPSIAAVQRDGGDHVLRERVAALDDDQRRVFRDALA